MASDKATNNCYLYGSIHIENYDAYLFALLPVIVMNEIVQSDFCSSVVKNLGPSTPDSSALNVAGCFDAGEELLDYWQLQWEAIHLAQDQVFGSV